VSSVIVVVLQVQGCWSQQPNPTRDHRAGRWTASYTATRDTTGW